MKRNLGLLLLTASIAGAAGAQSTRIVTPRTMTYSFNESNSARIGVMLGDNDLRDTLGVLVSSVVDDGPAAKAGIKEGDRIQAIGGVNLKMARDDADDSALRGMMSRRLTRELDKLKAGDDVELRVLSGGSTKTVRVKTVAANELNTATTRRTEMPVLTQRQERAALGVSLGVSITKRDTLGVFVMSVTPDGPAEKAGIVEGDRIARINGVDLRVPSSDAGDNELSRARARRFSQEVAKLKAGDAATLTVVSGGRQREVRVTAVKASELRDGDGMGFFFNDGAFTMPHIEFPRFENFPNFELRKGDGKTQTFTLPKGGAYIYRNDDGKLQEEIRTRVEGAMEQARKSIENARKSPGGTYYYRGSNNEIPADVQEKVERAMENARAAIEKARVNVEKSKTPIIKRSIIRS